MELSEIERRFLELYNEKVEKNIEFSEEEVRFIVENIGKVNLQLPAIDILFIRRINDKSAREQAINGLKEPSRMRIKDISIRRRRNTRRKGRMGKASL
jgi:hypothetical protein